MRGARRVRTESSVFPRGAGGVAEAGRKAEGGADGERGRARVTASQTRFVKMMATDAEEINIPTNVCPVPDNSANSTLSIKITRKNQDRHWKLRFIYLQCCEYRHTTTQPPSPPPTKRPSVHTQTDTRTVKDAREGRCHHQHLASSPPAKCELWRREMVGTVVGRCKALAKTSVGRKRQILNL